MGKLAQQLGGQSQVKVAPGKSKSKPVPCKCGGSVKKGKK
jgi:hypothetical protein